MLEAHESSKNEKKKKNNVWIRQSNYNSEIIHCLINIYKGGINTNWLDLHTLIRDNKVLHVHYAFHTHTKLSKINPKTRTQTWIGSTALKTAQVIAKDSPCLDMALAAAGYIALQTYSLLTRLRRKSVNMCSYSGIFPYPENSNDNMRPPRLLYTFRLLNFATRN